MRPIYDCPENNISAKSADDCARISTLQSYHYSVGRWCIPSNVITAPSDRRTDRRTLWHHRAVKIRRQIIADIIGITDILSERYRYMAHHYSLAIRQAIRRQHNILETTPDITHFRSPFYWPVHACRSAQRAINNIYSSLGVPATGNPSTSQVR